MNTMKMTLKMGIPSDSLIDVMGVATSSILMVTIP